MHTRRERQLAKQRGQRQKHAHRHAHAAATDTAADGTATATGMRKSNKDPSLPTTQRISIIIIIMDR